MRLPAVFLALVFAAGPLPAQQRFDMRVRNLFFAGLAGDSASLARGMKICEDILASDPGAAQALVWHGTGLITESRDAFQKGDQQSGIGLWQRGLDEMDRAAALAPNDPGVRIVRGAVLLTASLYREGPDARPLIEKGISDYEAAYAVQAPNFEQLGTHPRGELMLGLASAYSRLGLPDKARPWFERIRQELPGTPYAASAAVWLSTGNLTPRQSGCLGCHAGATQPAPAPAN